MHLPGKLKLLLGIARKLHLREIIVEYLLQCEVRHQIRRAIDEGTLKACLGHQGCTLRDLIHTLPKLDTIPYADGTYHVEHRRMILDDIRRDSAGIRDGIVHAALGLHMLTQVLHAGVHELHRIQRRTAILRIAGGMCGASMEGIHDLNRRVVRTGLYLIDILRMPAERSIEGTPHVVARHEGLRRTALFTRTAEEDHRALVPTRLEVVLHRKRRGQCTCA